MAGRRRRESDYGSLDSLLDTMTNVVGVLIVVLIVTQVNVSSAAKRIRANLPTVTEEMLATLQEKDAESLRQWEQLRTPPEVQPEELERSRAELRTLVEERDRARDTEDLVETLQSRIKTLEDEILSMRRQLTADNGRLAAVRGEIEEKQELMRDQRPKLVRLPNPREPDEDAKEVRVIMRGGRWLHFDREGILDRLAGRITPRKELLSRQPEYKNRYDRDKIAAHLETLKTSEPGFRFEFKMHPNGHIHLYCYPRDEAGETIAEVANVDSAARRIMARTFGDDDYLRYYVTADSFEAYQLSRRITDELQIPAGWVFVEDTARFVMNLSERGIIAEPDPDWEPPKPQPGPKPPAPKPEKKPTIDILD